MTDARTSPSFSDFVIRHSSFRLRRRGFTLVELLVVIGIIVIISALAIPAFNTIGGGQSVSSGADLVAGQLDLARQTALAENQRIELRVWNLGNDGWSGFQIFPLSAPPGASASATPSPMNKLQRLPQGVKIIDDDTFSTLLSDDNPYGGSDTLQGTANQAYKAIRFGPDGSTLLAPGGPGGSGTWTLTVVPTTSTATTTRPADNFITLQVDPVSGRVSTYQP